MAISVVLVEGRKLLREALALLLEKHADMKVVGEAEDTAAAAAVKLVRAIAPDVVVLTTDLQGATPGTIELWLDGLSGTKIAPLNVGDTGGFENFEDQIASFNGIFSGVHDLYLVTVGNGANIDTITLNP